MEYRHALGGAIDAIEHEAMQMDIQIRGRADRLPECDGAGLGLGALEPRWLDQEGR